MKEEDIPTVDETNPCTTATKPRRKRKGVKAGAKTTTKKKKAGERKARGKKAPTKAAGKNKGSVGGRAKRDSKAKPPDRQTETATTHIVRPGHCRFFACDKPTPRRGGVEGWRVGRKNERTTCPWTCPHCLRCQYCGAQFKVVDKAADAELVEL